MPIDTGRVADDMSDRGRGTSAFADEVLFTDVVDFGPNSAWDDDDEVTAALQCMELYIPKTTEMASFLNAQFNRRAHTSSALAA